MIKSTTETSKIAELTLFTSNLKELCDCNRRNGHLVKLRNGQARKVYFFEEDNKFSTMFGEFSWHPNGVSVQHHDFDIIGLANAENFSIADELKHNLSIMDINSLGSEYEVGLPAGMSV